MSDGGTITEKARAEVDNVVDELVRTIQSGVTHPDGSDGFDAEEAERFRAALRVFADMIMDAARGRTDVDIDASIATVVETIRRGVLAPAADAAFGTREARQLGRDLRLFADAVVHTARERSGMEVDAAIDQVVKTIRSGLFYVYGRASYAAVTADQLEAYLETFVDAVLAVVEKDRAAGGPPTVTA